MHMVLTTLPCAAALASDGRCLTRNVYSTANLNRPIDGEVTSAWRRHLSPIAAFSGIPCITRDGESRTSSVDRTQK
jgi:hypothetical protein